MGKVRVAFVGVGGMGQCAHLRNYLTIPECEVVALAELRPELAKQAGARYGVAKVYTDHRQMLKSEKFDALVSIQPFDCHAQLIPELFSIGVPVLTEKPIASSPEAGEKIVAALRASKAKYFVAYHKRSDPATMWAKKQIAAWQSSGEVGQMRYVRITMPPGDWAACGFSQLVKTDEKYPAFSRDPRPASMDEPHFKHYVHLVNYYIHQVNLMRHLLGGDYHFTHAEPAGIVGIVRGASGVTGVIEMAPYQNTLDWQEVALVCFERGWVKIELPAPMAIDRPGRVTIYRDPGNDAEAVTLSPQLPHIHAMRQQATNFIQAVKGEPTCLCPAEDALKDLQAMKEYLDLYVKAGGLLPK